MPLAERRDNPLRRAGVHKKGDTLFLKREYPPYFGPRRWRGPPPPQGMPKIKNRRRRAGVKKTGYPLLHK